MTLHMVKLCVGAASIDELAAWQQGRIAARRRAKLSPHPYHTTFQMPKRQSDLLDGGSLYWVIKGLVSARQKFVGFEDGQKDDGSPCCVLVLDPAIIAVRPTPRRAFQGWRYLAADDAPPDLKGGSRDGVQAMPERMRKDLAALGLL
ncbi:MAG: DUF1489 family protein [Hyphomicrobium sp.]